MTTQKCFLCETPCESRHERPQNHPPLRYYKCDNCGEFLISWKVEIIDEPAEKEKVRKFASQRKTETDKPKPFVLYEDDADYAELQEFSDKDRFDLFQWHALVSRLNENGEMVKRHIGF